MEKGPGTVKAAQKDKEPEEGDGEEPELEKAPDAAARSSKVR